MRIFPIAIALGLALASPASAASESAKMTGNNDYATGPSHHRSLSAKMHKQKQTQNPSSQSGSTSADTGAPGASSQK